jgi:hypothetical protein
VFLFTDVSVFAVAPDEGDEHWVLWSPMLSQVLQLEHEDGPFAYIDWLAVGMVFQEEILDEMVITVEQWSAFTRLARWMREHPAPARAPIFVPSTGFGLLGSFARGCASKMFK